MALSMCIPDLVAQRLISAKNADRAMQIFDELVAQHELKFGREAAEAMATEQTLKAMEGQNLNSKRQKLLMAKKQADILHKARHVYRGGAPAREDGTAAILNPKAVIASLVRDDHSRGVANVEYRWKWIKQSALGRMYGLLDKHRVNLLGEVRHKDDLLETTKAAFGEATDDVNAREIAEAWRHTSEWMRQRYNAAGGQIGKLEGWGLPQSHDGQLVGAVPFDQWRNFVVPLLDRQRMVDYETGGSMSDARLDLLLRDAYEAIVSDGWSRRSAGQMNGRSVANRHQEHRVLHFKDASGWTAYHDAFGAGTAYDAMMGHIETMSREIAMMEILGPNPNATVDWMKGSLIKDAATRGTQKERDAANAAAVKIDNLWAEINGENRRVGDRRIALFGSTLRNWQSATKLGSATLSSVSDVATSALVRHYNGLPVMKALTGHIKQLNVADPEVRAFARRAGIIGDELTGRMGAQGRMFIDESFGGRLGLKQGKMEAANEVTRRMADGVLRVSGLNAWTVAGREAMGLEFFNHISSEAGKKFDALDPAFRGFFERYGIGEADWDRLRATVTEEWRGADWIMPQNIADEGLRDRLMEGILTEIDFAVPVGGIAQRAAINATLKPGTVAGEIMRTAAQFKMFPITVMWMHGMRAMAAQAFRGKAGYAVAFLGATTMTGAIAFQMSELSKGKDPRPMTDRYFWGNAMLKGGGLGVYGDLIKLSQNEYGQSQSDIMAGPSWSTSQGLTDLGNALYQGKGVGKATGNLLKREVPGSSLWFVRAAYERLLVDTVAGWADPDYGEHLARLEKRAAKEGTGYFLPPGQGGAMRAPDWDNVLADAPAVDEPEE